MDSAPIRGVNSVGVVVMVIRSVSPFLTFEVICCIIGIHDEKVVPCTIYQGAVEVLHGLMFQNWRFVLIHIDKESKGNTQGKDREMSIL